jgi:nucleoside-specific outer membrane channel protein Tsx
MMLATAGGAEAADWSSTNVQLLHGTSYADDFGIDDEKKTIFTFEHADGWKYGDNFFFVDVSNPETEGTAYYAEFSPRLSLGKLAGGEPWSFGIVKDVLLSGTIEMGQDLHANLLGIGLALDLPKFAFADFNLYARKSYRDFAAEDTDTGWQITIDWLLPFNIGGSKWAFEGFADYAWGEEGGSAPKEDNLITAPRLLVDIGDAWGAPGHLQFGVEYQIWRNKFGIDGVDEDVPQVMVKWTI